MEGMQEDQQSGNGERQGGGDRPAAARLLQRSMRGELEVWQRPPALRAGAGQRSERLRGATRWEGYGGG